MTKEKYVKPVMEVVDLKDDVILTSSGSSSNCPTDCLTDCLTDVSCAGYCAGYCPVDVCQQY